MRKKEVKIMETKRKYVISRDCEKYVALLSEEQLKFLEWLAEEDLLIDEVYWDILEEVEVDFE